MSSISKVTDLSTLKNKQPKISDILESGHDDSWLYIKRNNSDLAKCIEDRLLNFDQDYKQNQFARIISDRITKRFSGKFISKKSLYRKVSQFIYYLLKRKVFHDSSSNKLTVQFQITLKDALENCVVESSVTTDAPTLEKNGQEFDAVVDTQNDETLIFGPNKTMLAECVESHLRNSFSRYKQGDLAKSISKVVAKRFYGKTYLNKNLAAKINDLFHRLRSGQIQHEINGDQLTIQLQVAVKNALKACAVNSDALSEGEEQSEFFQSTELGEDTNLFILNNKISDQLSAKHLPMRMQTVQREAIKNCAESVISATRASSVLENEKAETVVNTTIISDNEEFIFSSDTVMLSTCIENHLSENNYFDQPKEFLKAVAGMVAKRFSRKIVSKPGLKTRLSSFFHQLRHKLISHQFNTDHLTTLLQNTIKQALEVCTNNPPSIAAVSSFDDEPREIANILDYILVRWPCFVTEMIQSRNGRALLRKFAKDARKILINALNNYEDLEVFRFSLRVYWMNRTQRFFDGRNTESPYIHYRYTLKNPRPHVLGNINTFFDRSVENFDLRNPPVSKWFINKVLYIHVMDRPKYDDEFDIYDDYDKNGMRSAASFFENQIDQLYRILFFFSEFGARGISTDEDDIYDWPLPFDVIPEQIQGLAYNDCFYRDYLLEERSFYELFMGTDNQNEVLQCLTRISRVYEEHLIVLSVGSLFNSAAQISTSKPFITTTSSTKVMNTAISNDQASKRKGSVWANEYGKHFNKRLKTTHSNSCSNSNENCMNLITFSDSTVSSTSKVSCSYTIVQQAQQEQQSVENMDYGYVTYNDNDFNQLQLRSEELSDIDQLQQVLPSEESSDFARLLSEVISGESSTY